MRDRLESLRTDLAYALRQLGRAPLFTLGIVLSFALGIGANATMFGIVDRLLLQPVSGVASPERVFNIGERHHYAGQEFTANTFSWPGYKAYRDRVSAFEIVGAWTYPRDMALGRGAQARKIQGMLVSASFFRLTGTSPVLGRWMLPDEDRENGAAPVVVISHGFWQREFGGERTAIGSTLDIGSRRYTIVGVARPGFTGLQRAPVDVFMLFGAADGLRFAGADWATTRQSLWVAVSGRLRPDATPARAESQATSALRLDQAGDPDLDSRDAAVLEPIVPDASKWKTTEARVSKLLVAVSLFVLLIACANVANLLLARALRRRREIAVRLALGIGRGRLVRQLVTESVLLALLGAVGALGVVRWGGALVRSTLLGDYAWADSPVDARMLVFTGVVAVITGLVAGLVPAVQGSTPDLARALRESAREGSTHRSRTRAGLLIAQAAFSVVLLVGTGLFVRSLRNVNGVKVGMDTGRVLLGMMDLRSVGLGNADAHATFLRMRDRAAALPGVASASVAVAAPFRFSYGVSIKIVGRDSSPTPKGGGPYLDAVTPEFFSTLGVRILRGRAFTDADRRSQTRVMVIGETMSRLYWPQGTDPIGQCVFVDVDSIPCARVVGVVADTHRSGIVEENQSAQFYVPLEQAPASMSARVLLVRMTGDEPERMIEPLRRAMQSAAPNLPFADVRVMRSLLDRQVRPWKLGATMFGVFGALALVLTALGLYSVIAFAVVQRTHEMGVRIALGARPGEIRSLVVTQGVAIAVIGVALGAAFALLAGSVVEPLLFHESPYDPLVFAVVGVVLVGVAALASLVPATRASHVDPVVAMRAD